MLPASTRQWISAAVPEVRSLQLSAASVIRCHRVVSGSTGESAVKIATVRPAMTSPAVIVFRRLTNVDADEATAGHSNRTKDSGVSKKTKDCDLSCIHSDRCGTSDSGYSIVPQHVTWYSTRSGQCGPWPRPPNQAQECTFHRVLSIGTSASGPRTLTVTIVVLDVRVSARSARSEVGEIT